MIKYISLTWTSIIVEASVTTNVYFIIFAASWLVAQTEITTEYFPLIPII